MELIIGLALIWFGCRLRRMAQRPTRIIVEHVIRFESPPPGPGESVLVLTEKAEDNVVPFHRRVA